MIYVLFLIFIYILLVGGIIFLIIIFFLSNVKVKRKPLKKKKPIKMIKGFKTKKYEDLIKEKIEEENWWRENE